MSISSDAVTLSSLLLNFVKHGNTAAVINIILMQLFSFVLSRIFALFRFFFSIFIIEDHMFADLESSPLADGPNLIKEIFSISHIQITIYFMPHKCDLNILVDMNRNSKKRSGMSRTKPTLKLKYLMN